MLKYELILCAILAGIGLGWGLRDLLTRPSLEAVIFTTWAILQLADVAFVGSFFK